MLAPPPQLAKLGAHGRDGAWGADTGQCVKEGPSQGPSGNPASFVIPDVTEDP